MKASIGSKKVPHPMIPLFLKRKTSRVTRTEDIPISVEPQEKVKSRRWKLFCYLKQGIDKKRWIMLSHAFLTFRGRRYLTTTSRQDCRQSVSLIEAKSRMTDNMDRIIKVQNDLLLLKPSTTNVQALPPTLLHQTVPV